MSGPITGPPNGDELAKWVHAIGELTIPLFAGFSVTAVVVVSDDAANFRWPGATILALAIASATLIAAVQSVYHARKYLVSEDSQGSVSLSRRFSDQKGERWAVGARITYHFGIVALLAGLSLSLAPPHGKGTENDLRWLASIIALVLCVLEASFIEARAVRQYGLWNWIRTRVSAACVILNEIL